MPASDRLTRGVRLGYGSGSVATGAFGTVPGLMLLPYLTDSLGIAAIPRASSCSSRRPGT